MYRQDPFPGKIFDIIQEIANLSVGGNYLFRGEPEYHSKVSSTLYRECARIVKEAGLKDELSDFNIKAIEKEILEQVKAFIPPSEQALDLSIFTQLQHYSSQTNLIDFTTDFNIALFFACDGQPNEKGRVIVQKTDLVKTVQPLWAGNRVLAQKSVFVRPERGYIDLNEANYKVVNIPACLKEDILRYLRNTHGITTETIYNDLHGYIRNREIHKSAYSEFYIAFAYQNKAEKIENPEEKHELWDKAIEHYDSAVGYNPNFELAYTNLITLHSKKRENDRAMRDRLKELEINPGRAPGPYTDRDHKAEWMLIEADFIPWLAQEENLTLLGKALGIELELEAQEVNIGGFRADILCKNTVDDSWVLIENQLETTDHKVGQLLTYAVELDASTVIWIAKTFRHEHREMLDRQNRITDERYRFFGVEMKVGQIEDSPRAIQFDVVSSPNDWVRGVSQDIQPAANQELSETQQLIRKFWTGLREYMNDNDSSVNCPAPTTRGYLRFSIGRTNFFVHARLASSSKEIGIWLYMKGDNAKAHYHLLKEQQKAIHNEFGETLEWYELPENESSRISLNKGDTDPLDENDWPHQYEWFTAKLERFNQVFRPRIQALNAADWMAVDDDP